MSRYPNDTVSQLVNNWHCTLEMCTSSVMLASHSCRVVVQSYKFFLYFITFCNFRNKISEIMRSTMKSKLSPWSQVLLEKLPVVQLLKNFPTFYITQRHSTVKSTIFRDVKLCSPFVSEEHIAISSGSNKLSKKPA
jgi:hypothetical protein